MKIGRKKAYSITEIKKVPCVKCGKPSRFQWSICADGNRHLGLCWTHDIELNALAMTWAFGDTRNEDILAYAREKLAQFQEENGTKP